jgi:hypothetical protein
MRKIILSMTIATMILTVSCGKSTDKKQVEEK